MSSTMIISIIILSCTRFSYSMPINKTQLIGGCNGTEFGCPNKTQLIGGCNGTEFGCCNDNITPCVYLNCSTCVNRSVY